MLKIEYLKVGDELEFISDEDREYFIDEYDSINRCVASLINPSNTITAISESYLVLSGSLPDSYLNKILKEELKYFRKVETNKEVVDTPEVDSTYVNAGIKSYEESYTRMINGEVFNFKGSCVYYDKEYGNFMFGDRLLGPDKSEYEHFQVKKPWYEFASEENPILCKVWGGSNHGFRNIIGRVYYEGQYIFATDEDDYWDNATPVKPSECFQGVI